MTAIHPLSQRIQEAVAHEDDDGAGNGFAPRPGTAKAPTAEVAHNVAAVFNRVTDTPCSMITPAPKNPTPVTI